MSFYCTFIKFYVILKKLKHRAENKKIIYFLMFYQKKVKNNGKRMFNLKYLH